MTRRTTSVRLLLTLLAACLGLLAAPAPAGAAPQPAPDPDFTLSWDPEWATFRAENYTTFIQDIRERLGRGGAPVVVRAAGGEPTRILSIPEPAQAPGFLRLRIVDEGYAVTLFMRLQNAYLVGYTAFDARTRRTTYYRLREGEPMPAVPEADETVHLAFDGNYGSLEHAAERDRQEIALGPNRLHHILHNPRPVHPNGTVNQNEIAGYLLTLIQMVSEAARFREIEAFITTSLDQYTDVHASAAVVDLENSWDPLSTRVRGAVNGRLEPPVLIDGVQYGQVANVAALLGILAYACHPSGPARAAEPECPAPGWAGSVVSWVNKATGRFLDNGGSADDRAPIRQLAGTGAAQQQWRLADAGGGLVNLVNAASGKAVENGNDPGEDVVLFQWSRNSENWQKWRLEDAGGGAYHLVNAASGKVADSLGGTGDDPVVQRSKSGKDSQKWLPQFIDTVPTYAGAVANLINVGTTMAASTDGSDQDGDHLIMDSFQWSSRSAWRLENAGDSSYYLVNALTGKVVENAKSSGERTRLIQWSRNGNPWQKWRLRQVPKKQGYSLVNVDSGKVVQGVYDSTHEGAYLVQASATGDASQLWLLSLLHGPRALAGRPLTFTNADTGKVIDNGGDPADKALIYQRTAEPGASRQQWRLEFRDVSQAWITNGASGKALENGNGSSSGTPLIQWSRNDQPWQQWRLTTSGDHVLLQHVTSRLVAGTSEMGVNAALTLREGAAGQTGQRWTVTVRDDLPIP
ncbi:hypothetical protein JOF53_008449 [Crossiella equi]|uniref:Ricin B lectin domain-containing protein n=1 Tax=Crossiella equi TaxID=130796 RepID=A0ABS5AT40_9PSEU|nr:RICIN domain-containing protein [Crossiella equi]MBP2479577.1 hypothetical protein [Crossiella equi]